jgi:hypothetical protein
MDTIDGSVTYMPPRVSKSYPQDESRGIIRRLAQRWPSILMLWLAISMPLVFLVYVLIEPTYDSSSTLRIEPAPELFGESVKGAPSDFEKYLETQRNLICTDRVLDPVVATIAGLPGFPAGFPILGKSADPKSDVRRRLGVQIIPGTYLIRVSFNSTGAHEAGEVVKAVVHAFQDANRDFNSGANKVFIDTYEEYDRKLQEDIKAKQNELIELAERDDIELPRPAPRAGADPGDHASLEQNDARRRESRVNAVKASFVRDELASLMDMKHTIRRKLEQLNFESQKTGMARVYEVDSPTVSKTPTTNERPKYMAILPLGVLVALLGLFLYSKSTINVSGPGGNLVDRKGGSRPRRGTTWRVFCSGRPAHGGRDMHQD